MATAAFTSDHGSVIDMVQRRSSALVETTSAAAGAESIASATLLGTISRRYGLMTCDENVEVREIVATSGDLAVADRLAFLAAHERRTPLVVVAMGTEYLACIVDAPLDLASLVDFVSAPGAARVMSIVTERGITPALGPLACA